MGKKLTHAEWLAEGKRRFGEDFNKWRFVCPVCGFVQSVQDYKDAGAPQDAVAFSCVGRWRKEVYPPKSSSPPVPTRATLKPASRTARDM